MPLPAGSLRRRTHWRGRPWPDMRGPPRRSLRRPRRPRRRRPCRWSPPRRFCSPSGPARRRGRTSLSRMTRPRQLRRPRGRGRPRCRRRSMARRRGRPCAGCRRRAQMGRTTTRTACCAPWCALAGRHLGSGSTKEPFRPEMIPGAAFTSLLAEGLGVARLLSRLRSLLGLLQTSQVALVCGPERRPLPGDAALPPLARPAALTSAQAREHPTSGAAALVTRWLTPLYPVLHGLGASSGVRSHLLTPNRRGVRLSCWRPVYTHERSC